MHENKINFWFLSFIFFLISLEDLTLSYLATTYFDFHELSPVMALCFRFHNLPSIYLTFILGQSLFFILCYRLTKKYYDEVVAGLIFINFVICVVHIRNWAIFIDYFYRA